MSAIDARRHTFTFKIEPANNGSFLASVIHDANRREKDDVGALYYVVAVILIYGLSILMMIASYIRKNKMDRKLNRYLKEMANVRKREQQMQLFTAAAKVAEHSRAGSLAPVPHEEVTKKVSNQSGCSDYSEADTDWEDRPSDSRGSRSSRRYTHSEYEVDHQGKAFLDLPPNSYNTDSDNEASEGDISSSGKPHKSILKNASKTVTLVLPGCQAVGLMLASVNPKGDEAQRKGSTVIDINATGVSDTCHKDDLQVVSSV